LPLSKSKAHCDCGSNLFLKSKFLNPFWVCAGASVEGRLSWCHHDRKILLSGVQDIVPKPLWIEYTWTKVIYTLSDHTLLNDNLENKIYFSSQLVQLLVQLVLFSLWVLSVTSAAEIPVQVSAV
jgi:hypothetical protein